MRFHFGAIPGGERFPADQSWKPLREPGPILMQCFALPVGAAACAVLVVLWVYFTPVTKAPSVYPLMSISPRDTCMTQARSSQEATNI
jgi:hypothetical protein